MSHGLKALSPAESDPSAGKEWTNEEEAAFAGIMERLKHLRETRPEEDLVANVRRAVLHALNNFGERRAPMIPFLRRRNVINRILGKCRHRLLGPKRPA